MYDNIKNDESKVASIPTQQALFEPWQKYLENNPSIKYNGKKACLSKLLSYNN